MDDTFPDDEHGDVLRQMKEQGDDLSAPRDVDFSVVFPDEASAQSFIEIMKTHFDKIRYSKIETLEQPTWDVTATRFMIPSYREITQMEQLLGNAAAEFGGENDGWGCFSVIK
ncbi:ribonuclease E inhibitor RraB [Agrobacterium vitis]|uniref:Ribonuclease E inhibitor RraB n=1 Tax=Agrobacterium vitis TaxID=373 RepID=A0A7K1RMU0_AGRVI|nr:ribonuclease E inhibitor RraB [Agrobacterium vitis]MVA59344.1 ribonuclease E inhibitor RraB [Agrobacterium vitis]